MSSEQLCKVCKMAPVKGCPNTLEHPAGASIMRYEGDDAFSDVCPNMKVVALRQRLLRIDSQITAVRHDPKTPLFQKGQSDLTQTNVLIAQTDWKTFLSHFKWVVGSKDPKFFVRIVTDMTLKQVYMGEASFRSRPPSQREESDLPIYNSLEDLLGTPDLVIIRVGFVVYFNRAMASILMEALLLRDGLGKPTWIVEREGQQFSRWRKNDYGVESGMPCCNDDVQAFVESRYQRLQLGAGESQVDEHEDGVSVGGAFATVPAPALTQLEDEEVEEVEYEEEVEIERPPDEAPKARKVDADEPFMDALTRRKSSRPNYSKPRRGDR